MLTAKNKVLILAGKRSQDALSDFFKVDNKALIPLAGKQMIEWVLNSVEKTGLNDFWISVNSSQKDLFEKQFPQFSQNLLLVESSQSPMNAVVQALKLLEPNTGLLITTADNPLLEVEHINFFLNIAASSKAELLIATVNGHDGLIQKYPVLKRTWHKLNPKMWLSGANLFFWSPKAINNSANEVLTQLEKKRKSPLGFASIVSGNNFVFLLKLLLQITSVEEANRVLSQTLGLGIEFVQLPFPEACIDVDKLSDYEIVEKLITERLK